MTEKATENVNETTPGTTTPPEGDTDKDKNFRALEDARRKDQERAQRLLDTSVVNLAKSVGLPTDDQGNITGIGNLLVKEYKADLGDDVPTDENFREFLTKQGYETGTQRTQQETLMGDLQRQADGIRGSTTTPTPPSDLGSLIKDAEAKAKKGEGSWDYVMSLKLSQQMQGN